MISPLLSLRRVALIVAKSMALAARAPPRIARLWLLTKTETRLTDDRQVAQCNAIQCTELKNILSTVHPASTELVWPGCTAQCSGRKERERGRETAAKDCIERWERRSALTFQFFLSEDLLTAGKHATRVQCVYVYLESVSKQTTVSRRTPREDNIQEQKNTFLLLFMKPTKSL